MFALNTKILVIDDMAMMRKFVTKFLKEFGFTDITEAKDGAEAWDILSAANPSFALVISDWSMPKMTGLELLKKIRADVRLGKTPVIMVTAESEEGSVIEAIKAGVTTYVAKPFTAEILKEKMESAHSKCKAA